MYLSSPIFAISIVWSYRHFISKCSRDEDKQYFYALLGACIVFFLSILTPLFSDQVLDERAQPTVKTNYPDRRWFCSICKRMELEEIDNLIFLYKEYGQEMDYHYSKILDMVSTDGIGYKDLFISGVTGYILATPIKDVRSKVITVALTMFADAFQQSYSLHQKLVYHLHLYAINKVQFEKIGLMIREGTQMCKWCDHNFNIYNYEGENSCFFILFHRLKY